MPKHKVNQQATSTSQELNSDYIELTGYSSNKQTHFFYHHDAEKFKKEISDEVISHKTLESIVKQKIEETRTIFPDSNDAHHSGLKFVRKGEPFFQNYKVKVKISAHHGLGKLRIGCDHRLASADECKTNGLPDNSEVYSPRKIVNSHK